MKTEDSAIVDIILEDMKLADKRDAYGHIFSAMAGFRTIFGGSFEYSHNPYVPEDYKGVLAFRDGKWLSILEQATDTVTRFHSMPAPKDDREKAEQYKKIWDNSSIGEKLLGNLNVMMEHMGGRIAVIEHEDLSVDCYLGLADKKLVEYLVEVVKVYTEEANNKPSREPTGRFTIA